jgi:hydroxymethylpyrimidine pyrophosphatase-like HAD family hydrolase
VCIDMDGTLLNSDSKISTRTASAVKSSLARGDLSLILATGKARPAAIAACEEAGLTGIGPCTSLRLFMYVPCGDWTATSNN